MSAADDTQNHEGNSDRTIAKQRNIRSRERKPPREYNDHSSCPVQREEASYTQGGSPLDNSAHYGATTVSQPQLLDALVNYVAEKSAKMEKIADRVPNILFPTRTG